MWCYRRWGKSHGLKSITDAVSNEGYNKQSTGIRSKVNISKAISRKGKMAGHILRHDTRINTTTEACIESRKPISRPRLE